MIVSERGLILSVRSRVARVGAEDQERPRVAGVGARVTSGMSIAVRPSLVADELVDDVVDLEQAPWTPPRSPTARSSARPAISARSSTPRPGLRDTVAASHASPPSTGPLGEALRDAAREVHQRAAVARQRVDRDPLVRAVVAAAGGAELDRRDPGLLERDRVGGAVAADAHRLAVGQPRRRLAEREHVRVRRRHARGRPDERARDVDVRDARIWASSSPGSCSGR